ncbi:MAG: uridine diphosphate-N-acetylglucosamine-binding protein YvcK [Candidatus Riflebacteria bacterium]|nr:uridine diphosphate-N-acetylglucosamine-binding protein YvcK [Candidatus Riflebacteria bacterium]
MLLKVRRQVSALLHSLGWAGLQVVGFAMVALALVLGALATLASAPAHLETIRSFGTLGLSLAALTALLIGLFWIWRGFTLAFRQLSWRDQETSERLRAFVLRKFENQLPPLVALGGGTGLGTLLKGLKELPIDLTAIVTVTDDGGSSGRLRKELQILPPGDIRNCLVSLSPSESLLSRLFQYRFGEGGEVAGHSFGNLFIAAMTGVLGDFGTAVREASSILAIRGQVIPVTCDNVELQASFADGSVVTGETAISAAGKRITGVALVPPRALPNAEALQAIDQARVVVLGPGSLFTSVIPNLLIPEIAERINRSQARVVYICNVMTQPGETDGFTAADHVAALLQKTSLRRIDVAIVNARRVARQLMGKYEAMGQFWVPPTVTRIEEMGIRVVAGDFLSETDLVRHDPRALGNAILHLLQEAPTPVGGSR